MANDFVLINTLLWIELIAAAFALMFFHHAARRYENTRVSDLYSGMAFLAFFIFFALAFRILEELSLGDVAYYRYVGHVLMLFAMGFLVYVSTLVKQLGQEGKSSKKSRRK